MAVKTLIFIPTYNERNNVERMAEQLLALGLDADVVFMDDHSPDGTGDILDRVARERPRVLALHRAQKLGIGSAHLDGIRWAYDNGYDWLITMDCDFTHSPADVVRLIANSSGYDVTTASRYMLRDSLSDWNPMRKALTSLGHVMTTQLLGIEVDATGALRAYNLKRIPRELFDLVTARGYGFFFESMFILLRNGFSIKEFPIVLPARTYDTSKMTWREAVRSGSQLMSLWVARISRPARFQLKAATVNVDQSLSDPQSWDTYWDKKDRPSGVVYEQIAALYRGSVIRKQLERIIFRNFKDGSALLHAGCGSGQVDAGIQRRMRITAIDISASALRLYKRNNPAAFDVRHASLLDLPYPCGSFDGVYNLGVLEHFSLEEIRRILSQFYRVLKPGGRVVIFWPHARATSVAVLKGAHWLMNDVLQKPTQFHPLEISLLRSRSWVEPLLHDAGFRLSEYSFGARDLFVQAVVVGEKPRGSE